MINFDALEIENKLRRLAGLAGLTEIDGRGRQAVLRLTLLAVLAWMLVIASPIMGAGCTFAAVLLLTVGFATLVGGVLQASQTNHEMAMLLAASTPPKGVPAGPQPTEPVAPTVSTSRASAAARLLSHGELHGRRYSLYSDGSIEMDTLFGTRWFASLDVAREFIGLRNGAIMSGLHLN